MRKTVLVILLALSFFTLEFFCFNLLGRAFTPDWLLIFIVFVDFSLGIRYGILAAACAGLLQDSFASHIFGEHILSFVACAYLAVVIRKYMYHATANASRLLIISIIVFINFFIHLVIQSVSVDIGFFNAIGTVLIPKLITTLIVTNITFRILKKCVLKYFALL